MAASMSSSALQVVLCTDESQISNPPRSCAEQSYTNYGLATVPAVPPSSPLPVLVESSGECQAGRQAMSPDSQQEAASQIASIARGAGTFSPSQSVNTKACADLRSVQASLDRLQGSEKTKLGATYNAERVLGSGAFGIVYQARNNETSETVAIKKVLQDARFKNRELEIMQELNHPNIVELKSAFHVPGDKPRENYLNVVMEYCPETMHNLMAQYSKSRKMFPYDLVQIYTYHMLRGVAYLTAKNICHRDIKPPNILIKSEMHELKICDFGSAKRLTKGEQNVAYICSRYYRAPELIFGATEYSTLIDMWSVACVTAEMILQQVLFPGDSGVDQLMEIIKVLGTPSVDDLNSMNPVYGEFKFPQIKSYPWNKIFRSRTSPEAVDWLSKVLQYDPNKRPTGLQACMHKFFADLRSPHFKTTTPLSMFWFGDEELKLMNEEMKKALIPDWVKVEQGGQFPRDLGIAQRPEGGSDSMSSAPATESSSNLLSSVPEEKRSRRKASTGEERAEGRAKKNQDKAKTKEETGEVETLQGAQSFVADLPSESGELKEKKGRRERRRDKRGDTTDNDSEAGSEAGEKPGRRRRSPRPADDKDGSDAGEDRRRRPKDGSDAGDRRPRKASTEASADGEDGARREKRRRDRGEKKSEVLSQPSTTASPDSELGRRSSGGGAAQASMSARENRLSGSPMTIALEAQARAMSARGSGIIPNMGVALGGAPRHTTPHHTACDAAPEGDALTDWVSGHLQNPTSPTTGVFPSSAAAKSLAEIASPESQTDSRPKSGGSSAGNAHQLLASAGAMQMQLVPAAAAPPSLKK